MEPQQKAAALILAMGKQQASLLLEHLTEHEVARLSEEIARLGEIAPDSREAVFQEALTSVGGPTTAYGGPDQARTILSLKGMDPDNIGAFHIVKDVDTDLLLQFFRKEHPQTVALILSYQPASFSAKILTKFDEQTRSDIALRIATLSEPSPEVIEHVERTLEEELGTLASAKPDGEHGGAKDLAVILNNTDKDVEETILEQIAEVDEQLAKDIRALMFVFEDIAALDDRAIQEILKNVDTKSLALAMKGVAADVKETFYRNLSERAQESLNEEIDLLGPVPRSDVENARAQIVAQVRTLEADGTIVIRRGEDGDLVE